MENAGFASIKVWGVFGIFSCFADNLFSLTETNEVTVCVASPNQIGNGIFCRSRFVVARLQYALKQFFLVLNGSLNVRFQHVFGVCWDVSYYEAFYTQLIPAIALFTVSCSHLHYKPEIASHTS